MLADFPHNDIRSALAMFDRRQVVKGFGPFPNAELRRRLLRGVAQLATVLGVEEPATILQYNGVLAYMVEQMGPSKPLAGKQTKKLGRPCFLLKVGRLLAPTGSEQPLAL